MELSDSTKERIRYYNDLLRRSGENGTVVITNSVASLPKERRVSLLDKVRQFDDFSEDNDPHKEHDFGSIEMDNETFFFKIDYYDLEMKRLASNPADPSVTHRVLTIMRAQEY